MPERESTPSISNPDIWVDRHGDYYTKFEVVRQVEKEIDPNDPLVQAGFYNCETTVETVRSDEFRMGLLPTPSGVFDKHAVSVVSISGPFWLVTLGLTWIVRRKNRFPKQPEEAA